MTDYQVYVGTAGPINFNGLVRHYFLRQGPNVADIQVNLAGKHDRKAQSHDIAKRVRPMLEPIAERYGARIKVAEVPPGPPVLSTMVAEIYGPDPRAAARGGGPGEARSSRRRPASWTWTGSSRIRSRSSTSGWTGSGRRWRASPPR